MPSKLDPHIATIEGWLVEERQLAALAIVGRLSEKYPEEFGTRQHSIVQCLLRAPRRLSLRWPNSIGMARAGGTELKARRARIVLILRRTHARRFSPAGEMFQLLETSIASSTAPQSI
jgi:hypothetical protein